VQIAYNGYPSRSDNVEVRIRHQAGETALTLNQQQPPDLDALYRSLGAFEFADLAEVTVVPRNDKYTIIDAVRFVPVQSAESVGGDALAAAKAAEKEASANEDELKLQKKDLEKLQKELAELEKQGPPVARCLSVKDEQLRGDYHICIRGNVKNLGPVVPRGFLSVASSGGSPRIPDSASGRLELARWIASPDNPLTARVYVNRVWSQLFGEGLVRTVDNFGVPGERPSHPELLDRLAADFTGDGWSTKRLIRRIVLSRAYQLSSLPRAADQRLDPENRLLSRQNRRRLDAESLHDALLQVSGELSFPAGGDSVRPETKSEYGYPFEFGPRAIYLPVFRNQLPDLLAAFDFPDPNLSRGKRTSSTLSTQALFLLNNPFVLDRARRAAARVQTVSDIDSERLEWLAESCFGRGPSVAERELADRYLHADAQSSPQARWERICQAFFGSVALRYVD
jgi:hypothetical protein